MKIGDVDQGKSGKVLVSLYKTHDGLYNPRGVALQRAKHAETRISGGAAVLLE
jgi:hypothetical protein